MHRFRTAGSPVRTGPTAAIQQLSYFGILASTNHFVTRMASKARGIGKSVHSAGQSQFCDLMIAARRRAGLTQQQLAKRLRRPQSFISKYESGERRLDVLEFIAVAAAIGADPSHILKSLVRKLS